MSIDGPIKYVFFFFFFLRNQIIVLELYLAPSQTSKMELFRHHRSLTLQKKKFSIKVLFSKFDQIRRLLRIWSHLLKKSLSKTSFFVQCNKVLDKPLVF